MNIVVKAIPHTSVFNTQDTTLQFTNTCFKKPFPFHKMNSSSFVFTKIIPMDKSHTSFKFTTFLSKPFHTNYAH